MYIICIWHLHSICIYVYVYMIYMYMYTVYIYIHSMCISIYTIIYIGILVSRVCVCDSWQLPPPRSDAYIDYLRRRLSSALPPERLHCADPRELGEADFTSGFGFEVVELERTGMCYDISSIYLYISSIYIYISSIYIYIYIIYIYIYHILINIRDMIKYIWYMIYDSRWHFTIAIKLILRNGSLAKNKWWFRHQHTMNWVCPQMLEVYCNIWPWKNMADNDWILGYSTPFLETAMAGFGSTWLDADFIHLELYPVFPCPNILCICVAANAGEWRTELARCFPAIIDPTSTQRFGRGGMRWRHLRFKQPKQPK